MNPVTGGSETGRVGDWIQTYSGSKFYPLDPRPEEVADNYLLGTEFKQLLLPHPERVDVFEPWPGLELPCWTPDQARIEFLARLIATGKLL